MKKIFISFLLVLFLMSCMVLNPNDIIKLVDFAFDDHLIVSMALQDDGMAWAGFIRDEYGLVKINPDRSTEIFDHTNSCLVDSSNIWDIELDSRGRVWMLNADGLICYDGNVFTRYDSLGEGYIPHARENYLEIDENDNVWFIGYNVNVNNPIQKIFCFDGNDFTSFSPEGVETNQLYSDVEIDKFGNVWFSFHRGSPVFLKYNGSEWTTFDTSDIGFEPYNVTDIEFDSDNNLWFNDDYTFSSIAYNKQSSLYFFDGENEALGFGENHYISELAIDDDDNVWITGLAPRLGVLNINHNWVTNNSDNVIFCREMEVDSNGDMWLATNNGIMIYRYISVK